MGEWGAAGEHYGELGAGWCRAVLIWQAVPYAVTVAQRAAASVRVG